MELESLPDASAFPASSLLDNTTPALRRAWHVVATSDEVVDEPIGVTLLDEPWMLARIDGRIVAFADQCPHRLAPLSAGRICDGTIQCMYHGWRFEPDGTCVDIPALPSNDRIPARAAARRPFGVEERYGMVWLAPEEPLCPIPEFPWWDEDGYDRAFTTILRTPVSAAQMVDNFLDAAHFPYVHAATFGVEEAAEVKDRGIDREGWTVETTFDSWYRNTDDPLVATGEHDALQPQVLMKRGHANYVVVLSIEFPVTGATLGILFVCTPETAGTTRIYKAIARNDFDGDDDLMKGCISDEDAILAEDLDILERYHRMELHLDARVELHTKADRLSLAWRRLMSEMVLAG